jgi:hypothetical protein
MVGTVSFYGEIEADTQERKRLKSTYVARMPEDKAGTFKAEFEAESRGWQTHLDEAIIRMTVTDGAPGIWSYLDTHPNYATIPKLLDFYHATEHLSRAAEALFGKKSAAGATWYITWKDKLKQDHHGASKLCRSIIYYMNRNRMSAARHDEATCELTFFKRNRSRMNYCEFIAQGLPIGSGPVEAACKTLVKQRLGKSGMRWSREGGQSVLAIRALVKSQRWDQFWTLAVAKQHELMQVAA